MSPKVDQANCIMPSKAKEQQLPRYNSEKWAYKGQRNVTIVNMISSIVLWTLEYIFLGVEPDYLVYFVSQHCTLVP